MEGNIFRAGRLFLICNLVCLVSIPCEAQSTLSNNIILNNADGYTSNFDTHEMNLAGNVSLSYDDKTIKADKIFMRTDEGGVTAEGNVVFSQGKISIRGKKVVLNLKTGMGTFYDAVFNIEGGLHIEGVELKRVDVDRYRAIQGKASTCQDCPQAWSVTGSSMDVQIEGYAEVHNALFQVRDAPIAYFPIFYFPVKTKRQSGLLLPQYTFSNALGSQIHVPYFWAISENSDSTTEYSYLSKGGHRLWNEFRWVQSDRSYLRGTASILKNDTVQYVPDGRYGASVEQRYQLNSSLTERFRGELASDRLYTTHFESDFTSSGLPTLVNEPSLSWQNSNQFAYGLLRFNRNNLPRDPVGDASSLGSINNWPELGYSISSFSLFGPIRSSADLLHTGFKRSSAALDPGTNMIRTGDRSSLIFRSSAPTNIGDFLDWDPRVELRADSYIFDAKNIDNAAQRAKIFFDQRLSTTFWRAYQTDLLDLRALKHTLTPTLRWSFSPPEARNHHPFFDDPDNPKFDIFDPEAKDPISSLGTFNEEQRLRPHNIVTIGANTRIIGRYGDVSRTYTEHLGASVERDYDLKENQFGRLRLSAFGFYGGARVSSEIAIDTKTGESDRSNDVSYAHQYFSLSLSQRVTQTEESYGTGASVGFIGPFRIRWAEQYNALIARVTEESYLLEYASRSKCWFFSLGMSRKLPDENFDYSPMIRLTVSEGTKGTHL